jgi:hypothetical protein
MEVEGINDKIKSYSMDTYSDSFKEHSQLRWDIYNGQSRFDGKVISELSI